MHPIDSLEIALSTRGPEGVRRPISISALSLAERIEFASVRWSWWKSSGQDIAGLLPGDAASWKPLAPLAPHEQVARLIVVEDDEREDACEVPEQTDLTLWGAGARFSTFQERFKTQLVERGVPTSTAHGLVGAFHEMASNAAEHSYSPVPPIAACEVSAAGWAFSVTDLGCGILGSLKKSGAFKGLTDDIAALRLAITDGVSCTGLPQRGRGFATLFKALVAQRCVLRFRSAEAVANWQGATPGADVLQIDCAPARRGFHVAVSGEFSKAA
jgi:hypothetical protein